MANILSIGLSALLAQQRSLAVTANNIANASTPGYSRQRVDLSERSAQSLGGHFVGTGVDVARVRRMSDELVAEQMRSASTAFRRADAFAGLAAVVENLLADDESGLAATLQSFVNALHDVANDPASSSARQAFLSEARTLVARFAGIDARLSDLESEIGGRMSAVTAEISSIGASLAEINRRVLTLGLGSGGTVPSDLLDQRDQQLERLAELVEIRTVMQRDGTTSVFIGSGQALVLGATSAKLEAVPGRFDARRPDVALKDAAGNEIRITQFVTGGELGALLDFRREMIAPVRATIGQITAGLVDSVNAEHARGMDLRGELGGALFAVAPPTVLSASTNTGGAMPTASIANTAALEPRSYRVHFDGADYRVFDAWTGAELAATGAGTGADPLSVGGLEIVFAAPPDAGDEFVVNALDEAAGSLSLLIQNPEHVAAAAPIRARAAVGNGGNGAVTLARVDDPANPALLDAVTIEFIDATTYSINGGGPLAFTPGDEIAINGLQLVLTGQPAAGDRFTIESNVGGVGDNRNALAIIDALSSEVLNGGTTTLQGAVGRVVAQVGALTAETQNRRVTQAAVLEQTRGRLDSLRGVNLDEEAAEMLRAEQMYQAAAKTIAVADSLFDSLLAALRR